MRAEVVILYIVFLLFLGIAASMLWRSRNRIAELDGITVPEAQVLRRQLAAVGLTGVLVVPIVFAPILLDKVQLPAFVPYSLLLFLPLLYFSISSIRNQLSLGVGRPFRGMLAIASGVSTLAILLVGVALVVYFSLLDRV